MFYNSDLNFMSPLFAILTLSDFSDRLAVFADFVKKMAIQNLSRLLWKNEDFAKFYKNWQMCAKKLSANHLCSWGEIIFLVCITKYSERTTVIYHKNIYWHISKIWGCMTIWSTTEFLIIFQFFNVSGKNFIIRHLMTESKCANLQLNWISFNSTYYY